MINVKTILKENEKRKSKLFEHYDPIMGVGSPIPRVPVFYYRQNKTPVMIPATMQGTDKYEQIKGHKSIEHAAIANGQDLEMLINSFQEVRMDHDFEFWALTCAKIKPKAGGDLIKFLLNPSQRKLLGVLEEMRRENLPIRVILLKARQWGGSTLVQIYMSWIQLRHKINWNSLIAAHINQAATNIRHMYKTLVDYYPLAKYTLSPFSGTTNIKIIKERSNKITIGSMQTPESIRSDDIAMFHASEVGLWKKTDGKEPEDLMQSALGTLLDIPYTVAVLESTAKGVGNYFHRTWTAAKRKENGFVPVFVAWFEIPMYMKAFDSEEDKIEFIMSMDGYELSLVTEGATIEGIHWYRGKLGSMNGNRWRMCSEFPTNHVEAFQSTGRRFFSPEVVNNARSFNRPALYQAQIFANAIKGPESLKNIQLKKVNNGELSIWIEPEVNDQEKVLDRYLVTVDIGGRSEKSDDSIIKVFDRYWMMEGGAMEVAAVWAGHVDFDHLAWLAVQICKIYDNALMAPEINKMREDTQNTEGDNFYTLVDEISDDYDNIFCRTSPEKIRQGIPAAYGFHMNSSTKPMVMNALNAAYRDSQLFEFDERACDQADTYEVKDNGSLGAVEGQHDDHTIASAIGAWVGLEYMATPKVVKVGQNKATKKKHIGMSTI